MTFEEWFKQTSEFSYIGPEAEEAERTWNYQQDKIDAIKKQLAGMQQKLESIKIDDIRPRHSEYDYGWRDCAITVLSDLDELLK